MPPTETNVARETRSEAANSRADAEPLQQLPQATPGGSHRSDRRFHSKQFHFRGGRLVRLREHVRSERSSLQFESAASEIELLANIGKMSTNVGEHVRILRALAGKHRRHATLPGKRRRVPKNPGSVLNAIALRISQKPGRMFEFVGSAGRRHVEQRDMRITAQPSGQTLGALDERRSAVGDHQNQFDRPLPFQRFEAVFVVRIFLEDRVAIDATETERVDTSAARSRRASMNPGSRLVRQVEASLFQRVVRLRRFGMQCRWSRAVIERE